MGPKGKGAARAAAAGPRLPQVRGRPGADARLYARVAHSTAPFNGSSAPPRRLKSPRVAQRRRQEAPASRVLIGRIQGRNEEILTPVQALGAGRKTLWQPRSPTTQTQPRPGRVSKRVQFFGQMAPATGMMNTG